MRESLELAMEVQHRLLPNLAAVPGLDMAALSIIAMKPAAII
jgi:hypothetical protein